MLYVDKLWYRLLACKIEYFYFILKVTDPHFWYVSSPKTNLHMIFKGGIFALYITRWART